MLEKKRKEDKEMDAKERTEVNAFMGPETSFEGKLNYTGAVRLDGRFKGEIRSDDTLIIGETGRFEGEIHVGSVIIQGEITGNVYAKEKVQLHHPGRVVGNMTAPTVVMDEGAVFEGNCKMKEKKKDDKKGEPKEEKGVGIFARKKETEGKIEEKTKEAGD
ncbi:MAG: polymer-forming cytoskeletal protein [Deltaproteobacteria bacterium]|nr:polymer-forming cytoskeletal protein [Deltaproteobacteria bacterium]